MKWLMVTLIAFVAIFAFADDGQSLKVSTDRSRFFKDSNGYHIAIPDNRELTLYEYSRPGQTLNLALKQIENTCNPDQELAVCNFSVDIAPFHYLLVWTKHPDPSKIGTVDEDGKITQQMFYYYSFKSPSLALLFSPDRLSCDNYQWTEGMRRTETGSLIVDSWSAELMFENFESNINENQTLANGFTVKLRPNSNKQFEVESVKSDFQTFSISSPPYLSAQVSNMNFVNTKNELCQVSFESSIGNAASMLKADYFSHVNMNDIKLTRDIVAEAYSQLKSLIYNKMNALDQPAKGSKK